ncbi:MAG: uberolysin/carnocyclin family circular bacteriocin [Eubacteriaceae bacterium]
MTITERKMKFFSLRTVLLTALVIICIGCMPNVDSMLGVSAYAARKIVDAIFAGMVIATIIGLIIAGGGVAVIGMALLKYMVKRLGRVAAVGW